jgi:transcriptional regulator with XRE-family HTH domain
MTAHSDNDSADPAFNEAVGQRLRAVRHAQHLSLRQVQAMSEGRFKSVVVGSYERGDRAVSVKRLAELADFYDVPISHLLQSGAADDPITQPRPAKDRLIIDLQRLHEGAEHPAATRPSAGSTPLERFVRSIQLERGDYAGIVLSLREDDLRPLSVMYGAPAQTLVSRWRESGLARAESGGE